MTRLTLTLLAICAIESSASADLIAFWNFNSYDGNATTIAASAGTGTLTTSSGLVAADLSAGAGTSINAGSDPAGTALTIFNGTTIGDTYTPNNGEYVTLSFSTLGLENIALSYATVKSTGNSFTSNQWSYSTNGTTFTNFGGAVDPANSNYGPAIIRDFSSIVALDNKTLVYLRYTLNGANTNSNQATRFNSIDNIQVIASQFTPPAVPEPASLVLLGSGALGLVAFARRRRLAKK